MTDYVKCCSDIRRCAMKSVAANDIERFIYEKCFDHIYFAVSRFASEHPISLELPYCCLDYLDEATV